MSARRLAIAAALAAATMARGAPAVDLRTDDVERFYEVYDATHGHPTAAQLQSQYLDPGSRALHQFVVARVGDAAHLADMIARRPADFAKARACLPALARTRERLADVYARMAGLYPAATFPPVIFVIGRDNTVGTTTRDGILMGLETAARVNAMGTDVGERFTRVIAHELAHAQQPGAQADAPPDATLLYQVLLEGGAEFMAERTAGEMSDSHLEAWTRGHECAIEQAFAKDMSGTDTSHWLYNGLGTPDAPGDLGYWVGYRIAKAYYAQAADKHQAIHDLLNVDERGAAALLERSGWMPRAGC